MSGDDTRSDARIHEEIRKRLTHAAHLDSHDVHIEVSDGVVRLEGSVPESQTKEAIEVVVHAASGVRGVENQLQVAGAGAEWPRQRWMSVQNATVQTGTRVPPGAGDSEAGTS